MALTTRQVKERLPHGAQAEIARELEVDASLVSAVVNKKHQLYSREKVEKVREAIARRIGEPVQVVWGKAA